MSHLGHATVGTATVDEFKGHRDDQTKSIQVSITSNSANNATFQGDVNLQGLSLGAYIEWTAAGQPTDQFDITILDEDGRDLLNGQGANITASGAGTKEIQPNSVGDLPFTGRIRVIGANMGDTKTAQVRFYWR